MHLRDLGSEGQGPGEFQRPRWVAGTPDGRIFVTDRRSGRINVYGPEPGAVDEWPLGRIQCCIHPMVATEDGVVWVDGSVVDEERADVDYGMQAYGSEGAIGEPFKVPRYEYDRWTLRYNGREIEGVPYAPHIAWAIAPTGVLIAGVTDRYRFEIISPAGPKTVIERYWEPLQPIAEEIENATRRARMQGARTGSGDNPNIEWDGRLPQYKPVFHSLMSTHSGDVWVFRQGAAQPIVDCDPKGVNEPVPGSGFVVPNACFSTEPIIDAFEAEGRYLGRIEEPRGVRLFASRTFVRGDTVITQAEDEAGTIMVKRYRLVLPSCRFLPCRTVLTFDAARKLGLCGCPPSSSMVRWWPGARTASPAARLRFPDHGVASA